MSWKRCTKHCVAPETVRQIVALALAALAAAAAATSLVVSRCGLPFAAAQWDNGNPRDPAMRHVGALRQVLFFFADR
jgi:hypothetical protein